MNLTLATYRLANATLPRLSPAGVDALGTIAGTLGWLVATSARRAVRDNLRIVLGREPTARETRRVFVTAAHNYCDLFSLPQLRGAKLRERVTVEGWEHLDRALASGRGALIASLHLGNLEVVGYAATSRGLKIMLPVEKVEPPELLDLMIAARERAGLTCEPVGAGALDQIRAALRANSIVGIGADRVTLGNGHLVRFCGRPARLPIAAALLARRTGAPLLPMGSYRQPGRRYLLRIGPPITDVPLDRSRGGAIALTERLLDELETMLRHDPTQWVVFRPIWESGNAAECPT